jgi:hypothetical protein
MKFIIKIFGIFVATIFLFGFWLWCTLAIRFSGLPETLAFIACGIFAAGVPLALIFLPNRKRTIYGVLILCIFVLIGWSQVAPSHDRNWVPSVAKLPYAKTEGDQIQIHNIRNFDYRTEKDFSVRYYDKTYDLNKLETIDYVLSHWEGNETIAHSIFSFGFAGGDYLTVSVETRLEEGEPQSGLRGLFKQYELIYILGDERDLLRLRTNFRKEDVFLYPIAMDKKTVREVFNVVMERVNNIASKPEFYNTITQSCLSSLVGDLKRVITPKSSFDFRRLANGYSDELLYENGWIDSTLSFAETKRLHYINQYVQDDIDGRDYSSKIRPHINKN